MEKYVHLIGAEEVRSAGHAMANAASEMQRAASSIDASMEGFLRRYEDATHRLVYALEEHAKALAAAQPAASGRGNSEREED
jgi:hypothetical protein